MSMYNSLSDDELLTLIKESDKMAFDESINRYHRILYKTSKRMLIHDKEQVDEPICYAYNELWLTRFTISSETNLFQFLKSMFTKEAIKIMTGSKHVDHYLEIWSDFLDTMTDNPTSHVSL